MISPWKRMRATSFSHDNGRFLLFARELREDETVSDIMEQFQQMS